jgi:hypothetical protein
MSKSEEDNIEWLDSYIHSNKFQEDLSIQTEMIRSSHIKELVNIAMQLKIRKDEKEI